MKYIMGLALLTAMMINISPAASEGTSTLAEAVENTVLVGDVKAGQKRYYRECRQCHGPKGKGASSYPKLVGQPAEYLTMRLKQYRAGEKLGPNTPLMAPQAKKLSDQHIADLVAFIIDLQK